MVSVAIAVPVGDVIASAFVDVPGPIAHAAYVVGPHAVVDDVAHAVSICIGDACASADAEGIELVPVAVAVSVGNGRASAFVDVAWAVADAAGVEIPNAIVHVVAHTVSIFVGGACASTDAKSIQLVPVAVAVSARNVTAPAFVDVAGSVADAAGVEFSDATVHVVAHAVSVLVSGACAATDAKGVELVSVAVAVPGRDGCATALVDVARSVADAAGVEIPDATVHVVAHTVSIHVGGACAATDAQRVRLVSVAVAISVGNVRASAFIDVAGSVADAAGVEGAHAVVDVVAHAVAVHIGEASPSAHAQGVVLVPVAIAETWNWIVAPALQDCARPVADAASVEGAHAVVRVVTNAISIFVGQARAAAHAEGVQLVAATVAVAFGDACTSAFVNLSGPVANAASVERADAVVDVVAHPVSI